MSIPATLTVEIDALAAESALGDFLDRLQVAHPEYLGFDFLRLTRDEIETLIRIAFSNGFAAAKTTHAAPSGALPSQPSREEPAVADGHFTNPKTPLK